VREDQLVERDVVHRPHMMAAIPDRNQHI
jgi:hypothetical protein